MTLSPSATRSTSLSLYITSLLRPCPLALPINLPHVHFCLQHTTAINCGPPSGNLRFRLFRHLLSLNIREIIEQTCCNYCIDIGRSELEFLVFALSFTIVPVVLFVLAYQDTPNTLSNRASTVIPVDGLNVQMLDPPIDCDSRLWSGEDTCMYCTSSLRANVVLFPDFGEFFDLRELLHLKGRRVSKP